MTKEYWAARAQEKLAPSEADHVNGGISTLSVCTIPARGRSAAMVM